VSKPSGSFRIYPPSIGPKFYPWLTDLHRDILFAHHEVDGAESLALVQHEIERSVNPIFSKFLGYIRQVAAGLALVIRLIES
jgi:hypothetical protein